MANRDTIRIRTILLEIWAEALRIPSAQIPLDRNFFSLGGDSILLMSVMDRVNTAFFPDSQEGGLPITDFFAFTTVQQLTNRLTANLDRTEAREAPVQSHTGAIAIIGMGARVPGASTPEEFWKNLREGRETIRVLGESELVRGGVTAEELGNPRYVRAAGFVEDVQTFDADYFGLTAAEAAILGPEQRLLLECARYALEEAGYGVGAGRVGVFTGFGLSTYLIDNLASSSRELESSSGMRILLSNTSPATRISYLLNLTGPSITIDTACSSSLVAVHQACRSLLSGECDMALAGGATVRLFAPRGYRAEDGGIFSPDGHCRPFDRHAQGTVGTSGAGMVLLKRLDSALAARDSIIAVIRGTAINNDGRDKMGYTAPSATGQAAVIKAACEAAGVEPRSLQYIEAHGTATAIGDLIEIEALNNAFGAESGKARCVLGALKANLGHLEAAAGVAGLMKVALSLAHGEIPPLVNLEDPNPRLYLERTPFHLNREVLPWPPGTLPRRAGVSSFGIGGTNAHAVLEEAPRQQVRSSHRRTQLVVLSARSPQALGVMSDELAVRLLEQPQLNLADVAYTLQVGRATLPCRRFVVCSHASEAVVALQMQADVSACPEGVEETPVVFMFPGEGAACADMACGLMESEPVFREHVQRCADLLRPLLGVDIRENLTAASGSAPLSCYALFTLESALAMLWRSWGVLPSVLLGQGVGEYVAAFVSGALILEDALRLLEAHARMKESGASQMEFDRVLEVLRCGETERPNVSAANGLPLQRTGAFQPSNWIRGGHDGELTRALQLVMEGAPKIVLEMGPGAGLCGTLAHIPGVDRHTLICPLVRQDTGKQEATQLLRALGAAWQAGARVDWISFNARNQCHRVRLPAHPLQRRRHWIESGTLDQKTTHSTTVAANAPCDWLYVPVWKQRAVPERGSSESAGCCVLLDAGTGACQAAVESLIRRGGTVIRVRKGSGYCKNGDEYTIDPTEPSHYLLALDDMAERGARIDSIVHAWHLGAEDISGQGFYSLMYLCQAWENRRTDPLPKLVVLTSDAQIVLGEERGNPHDAILAVCIRVIAREFPNVACRSIDVSLADVSAARQGQMIDRAIGEALEVSSDPVVAIRGATCFVPTYERLAPTTGAASLVRAGGSYLITGGLGGIGLTLAECLASDGAGHLALVSRSEFPSRQLWDVCLATGVDEELCRRIRKIRAIEALGAEVLIVRADVANRDQVRQAVTASVSRFGTLNGVIHAAGVAGGGVLALKDSEAARRVLAPKIAGTLDLQAAIQDLDLDFFICCSSIASVLAPAGQFDYVAANAFQDAFALAHDRQGRTRYISVNWDGWREVGMARNSAAPGTGFGMSCEEGCRVMRHILESPRAQWVVSMRSIAVAQAAARERVASTRSQASAAESSCSVSNSDSIRPPGDERSLVRLWEELLGIEQPGVEDDFFMLGGDSLLVVQLGARMESCFGVSLSLREVMQEPTISGLLKLVRHRDTEHGTVEATS